MGTRNNITLLLTNRNFPGTSYGTCFMGEYLVEVSQFNVTMNQNTHSLATANEY